MRFRTFSLFVFLLINIANDKLAFASPASEVVNRLNSSLIEVMKNAESLGYTGRFKKLSDIISDSYNLEYIAQFAVGNKNWKSLTSDQKESYLKTFRSYSIANYANQFDGYTGEIFEVTGEHEGRSGKIEVASILKIPGDENVSFLYILSVKDGIYKIVNVIVDGVSDLALKRSEFMKIMNEKGYEGLEAHLNKQVAQLSSE